MLYQNPNTGWQVAGYATQAHFTQDEARSYTMNTPDMMLCALLRDRGKRANSHRMRWMRRCPPREKQANSLSIDSPQSRGHLRC
jgi:hypothetical protein